MHLRTRLAATACLLAGSLVSSLAAQSTTKVIFLGHGGTQFTADVALQKFLETRYGKSNVTFLSTEPPNVITADSIKGYDVAVLSSSPSSGRYRGRLDKSTTPIVNFEEAMCRNAAGEFRITDGRTKETELGAHSITIKASHPITKGFTVNQKVAITTGAAEVWWSTGLLAKDARNLAADDDTATNGFITYIEAGGTLLDNSKAPCRRVMFGFTDFTFNFFTAAGKTLLGQAIDWAACGCCAQASHYGVGLAGKNGIPTLRLSAEPKFGSTINVLISNSSGATAPGLLLAGQQQASAPFLGGRILVNPTFQAFLSIPGSGATFPTTIPNLSALCGVSKSSLVFRAQLLQLDKAASNGVSMTRGLTMKTGK